MQFCHFPDKSPAQSCASLLSRLSGLIRSAALPALLGLSVLSAVRASQDDGAATQDDAPAKREGVTNARMRVEEGEKIYRQRCLSCHSKSAGDTLPFGPPNLHGIFKGQSSMTTTDVTMIIVKGKNGMPGWGNVLTKREIDNLIAYLRTL